MTVPPPQPDATEVVEWWRRSWPPKQRAVGAVPVLHKDGDQAEDLDDAEDDADEQPRTTPAYDLNDVVERLGLLISETPEERAERMRAEREDWHERQGETPAQREARHRSERLAVRRQASAAWRQPQSERARRFRRWCILTTASAVVGYSVGAVQLVAHVPIAVAALAAGGAWFFDLRMRGWGQVRVSEVRGAGALTVLVLVRVPLASALVGALGLAPLITLLSTSHH
ncbi:hypothetical protein AB0O82_03925 [Kitasatospora sp. NPDC088264]|uniref:hypothetical protein n=1 Tax=Kitasatospora sp. NPDC088264 TaxID=3155296 RepID=UPI00343F0F17